MPLIHRLILPALLCLAALLAGCALNPLSDKGGEAETYYLDAGRGFAIDYPSAWTRQRSAEGASVHWTPDEGESLATVTSLPPAAAVGGYARMLADFTASRPGFVLTGREEVELDDGTPALQVLGHTPSRTLLAIFVTTRRRALILEYSAPPASFDRHRPLFWAMAASLIVLD